MTSRSAGDFAEMGRFDQGADKAGSATPPDSADPKVALGAFLCGALAAAQEVIEQILARQQAMMDVVSRVAVRDGGGETPNAGPEEMSALIAALQSDDLVRQELENLARAHAVMARAVQEILGGADEESGAAPSSAPEVRWTESLMKAVSLEEMRQRFTRHLTDPNRG